MRNIHIYGILVILLATACKREIDIDIENKPSILVVDARLQQDSLIGMYLSWTQNIKDNGDKKYEDNAVVEVFDADTSIVDVLQKVGKGLYRSAFYQPMPGMTYLFKISVNDKVYWANENMPDTLECQLVDTSRIIFQGKPDFFQITIKLNDTKDKSNYYGLMLRRNFETYNGQDTSYLSEWLKLESIEFILTEDPQSKFSNQHLIFSDRFFDGNNQLLRFGANDLFTASRGKTKSLEFYVSTYSSNAYFYYTSLNEHLFYQNDPFAQPTLVRGNVEGAFGGVVGSCVKRFDIKF